MVKQKNHFYSKFHIRKWQQNGGRLFEKETQVSKKFNPDNTFFENYYYSNDELGDELENRIADFEAYIGNIIKSVDNAKDRVSLTGKEYELLKLYCMLCANRYHRATEVIKSDESGVYTRNNYLFGVPTLDNQKDVLQRTAIIVGEFERLVKTSVIATVFDKLENYPSPVTAGLHLEIFRCDKPSIIISNCCCLSEITCDSDYLYTYVPVSPYTALFLIKSKYYINEEAVEYTKVRFAKKYFGMGADPYISVVFGQNDEKLLCTSILVRSAVHMDERYLIPRQTSNPILQIKKLTPRLTLQFNSMLYEDGDYVIYCDPDALRDAQRNPMPYREITVV